MPEKPPIFSGPPFTASITVRQNAVVKKETNDRGYYDLTTNLDPMVLLDITITANSLTELSDKIEGHVGLIQ